jgi:hypothetical protein
LMNTFEMDRPENVRMNVAVYVVYGDLVYVVYGDLRGPAEVDDCNIG